MATKKKYKKLTNREKQINKEVRSELREKGIIPPVKKRLNRKKFAEEVITEFKETLNGYEKEFYVHRAIACMLPLSDPKISIKISSEEVGVLKVLKMAIEMKKYLDTLKAEGKNEYIVMDMYEVVVKPILEL